MKKDAFDDTGFLGDPPHVHELLIGIAVVGGDCGLHPLRSRSSVRGVVLLVEQLDLATGNRHIDDADLDFFGKLGDQRASEEVRRTEARRGPAQWRHRGVPIARFPLWSLKIYSRQHLEAAVARRTVLVLNPRETLHVGLPEAEENVEILVLCADAVGQQEHPR